MKIKNSQKKCKTLEKQVKKLENEQKYQRTQLESSNQYGRRNNLEISGIPNKIKDEDLEKMAIDIMGEVGVEVGENEVEACHRLPITDANRNKKVIIRLTNKKN